MGVYSHGQKCCHDPAASEPLGAFPGWVLSRLNDLLDSYFQINLFEFCNVM